MIENAVILVAGSGTRLKPLTDNAPKCLTEVNTKPILANALENLLSFGIKTCTIVTGYMADTVERAARSFNGQTAGLARNGMKISFVHNEIYSETNDMYSLWLARESLEQGAMVLEGDVFFRDGLIGEAAAAMGSRSYYFVGRYDGRANEVVIRTTDHRRILSIEILRGEMRAPEGENTYMSSGILVAQKAFGRNLSRWMTGFVEKHEVNVLFDDVLSSHIGETELHSFVIEHSDWVEIDTLADLRRAEAAFGDHAPVSNTPGSSGKS